MIDAYLCINCGLLRVMTYVIKAYSTYTLGVNFSKLFLIGYVVKIDEAVDYGSSLNGFMQEVTETAQVLMKLMKRIICHQYKKPWSANRGKRAIQFKYSENYNLAYQAPIHDSPIYS
ncbi:hypothetical protein [Pectobacterium aroidearum]|uniref:hypothetical protein n=1 Tax=Pectobacterium aroidearum TaxID=1201031 RepID=UPI003DA52622